MEVSPLDRLGVRLLALNLRVSELDAEIRSARLELAFLESRLGDARLARAVGGDPPGDLHEPAASQRAAELRSVLEARSASLATAREHRRDVRIRYTLGRAAEHRSRGKEGGG